MKRLLCSNPILLLGCASVMGALYLVLRFQGDLRFRIPETIGILLATSILYLVSCYLALRVDESITASFHNKIALIVGGAAVVFRLIVFPLAPSLSDDVFRYRWEGMMQAEGGNPYQSRPVDPEWNHLRDETFHRVSVPDAKAGYGPLVELIEAATYRVVSHLIPAPHRQAFWFKAPAALFDLGTIVALWALLQALGLPPVRVLIYAWSPVPIMEFWATGHNDAVAVFFVIAALLLAAKERWLCSFSLLSLAACAKIWPLILFPILIGRRKGALSWLPDRWWQWTVLFPITAVLAIPYWSNIEENAQFMSGFLGGWRNNDSIYGLLLWLTGDQYPAKHIAFGIIIATVFAVTWLRWRLEAASLTVICTMLAVSANCHPWYLTWIVPLLAVVPLPALLLWTILMPLAYRVVIDWTLLGEWNGSTPSRWLIYVPVCGLLLSSAIYRCFTRTRDSQKRY
jgi:alpha-1,6-mannosyltransferase